MKTTVPRNSPIMSCGERVQSSANCPANTGGTKGCQNGTRPSLIGIPATPDITRFEAGPAAEISTSACFGLRVRKGLIGTGFAHPKPTKKINAEPTGSRCARGLSVSRPIDRGVGSPSPSAT